MDTTEKRSRLEDRARLLFAIYSDATAEQRAWEHLSERERKGWRDVADFVEDCPTPRSTPRRLRGDVKRL